MSKSVKWLIAAVVVVLLGVVGGPFVYIHFIQDDAPAKLAFSDSPPAPTAASSGAGSTTSVVATTTATAATSVAAGATTAAPTATSTSAVSTAATSTTAAVGATGTSDVAGVWKATADSVVGYRVKEVLFGQSTEAVGRTSPVDGTVTVDGSTVSTAEFTIDMTTVKSDQSRRDGQFKGRIMDVATYPTATFKLTTPISLASVPGDKEVITTKVTGELTLKGKTNPVAFDLSARRNGANIEVNGQIPVVFADYGIDNPSTTGINTEDHGLLEFLLVFAR